MMPVRIVDRTDGIIACDNDKYHKEKDSRQTDETNHNKEHVVQKDK
jgi:hypothetical protein